jgi:hypothetical protein
MSALWPYAGNTIYTLKLAMIVLTAIIHIIFAGAVATDAGKLHKQQLQPLLVSGVTWAFATLLGGVFVAAVYWLMHHSTLTRR